MTSLLTYNVTKASIREKKGSENQNLKDVKKVSKYVTILTRSRSIIYDIHVELRKSSQLHPISLDVEKERVLIK